MSIDLRSLLYGQELGAKIFLKDDKNIDVHLLDGGHFITRLRGSELPYWSKVVEKFICIPILIAVLQLLRFQQMINV